MNDLKLVIQSYASCKAEIIKVTGGCNGLSCERDIARRACDSLRQRPNELDTLVEDELRKIQNSVGGRDIAECEVLIDQLRELKEIVQGQINCRVDELVARLENIINRVEQDIRSQERVCDLLAEAELCSNKVCVGIVAAKIDKSKVDAVLWIKDRLEALKEDVQAEIELAAADIARIILDGREKARCVSLEAQNCVNACK